MEIAIIIVALIIVFVLLSQKNSLNKKYLDLENKLEVSKTELLKINELESLKNRLETENQELTKKIEAFEDSKKANQNSFSNKIQDLEILNKKVLHYQELLMQACQDMTEIATSDGVLSANEEKVLSEKLEKYGFRIDSFQHFIKKNLENTTQETQIIDQSKQKGDEFEKFIVQKFDNRFFKCKAWTGDKYIEGIYGKNSLDPDLVFEYSNLKGQSGKFAVECKYRTKWYEKDGIENIEWAKEGQLNRYKKFAETQQMPTFIIIGVGGKASQPEFIFVLPIEKINENILCKDYLMGFRVEEKNLGFSTETEQIFGYTKKTTV